MSQTLVYPVYLIWGKTEEGEALRPSDWPQRFAGQFAVFRSGRIQYSRNIYPSMHDGYPSLVFDEHIRQRCPIFFEEMMKFIFQSRIRIFVKNSPFEDFIAHEWSELSELRDAHPPETENF